VQEMNSKQQGAPVKYLIITLVWTWLFWFGAVFTGQHFLQFPTVILSILGFLGPFGVALIMVKLGYWEGTVT
jgi:hypothetical protein